VLRLELQGTRRALAAAGIGSGLFAIACALPRIGLWRGVLGTSLFQSYGDRVLSGHVPYRDFSLEYPPGALPAFVVPSLGPARAYDAWFMGFELACGLACVWLVALGLARLGVADARLYGGVAFAALVPLALGPLTLHRYDLWAAALCTAGVVALVAGRERLGFGALGAGAAAKIFPVVLLPLAYLYVRRRRGERAARRGLLAFVAIVALAVGPFLAVAPGGVRFSLARQTGRALQLETLGSSVLLAVHAAPHPTFGSGSWNLEGSLPDALAALQTVAQLAAVALVWLAFARSRRGPEELVLACAAALAAWVVLGKVLSPQFLLWLVPLVALVLRRRTLAVAAALAVALGLTHAVYPGRYDALVRLESFPIALLAVRNAILVAIAVVLYRQSVAQEVRAEGEREGLSEPVLLDGRERERPDRVPGLEP